MASMHVVLAAVALASGIAPAVLGEEDPSSLKLPGWFQDGMMLQTRGNYGARAILSGEYRPREVVTIQETKTSSGKSTFYNVTADEDGNWKVTLKPGGPTGLRYKISVQGSRGEVRTASDGAK